MTDADPAPSSPAQSERVHTLDALGLKCPLPALRTRKALARLAAGATLVVTASDPMAAIDIPNLVRETGDELVACEQDAGALRFVIRRRAIL